uniref:Uncharacterized protein n=3 Tax=unclassified bacterial viruses TaxID=12333 RepID=A0AAU6W0V8_9VIRU
MAKSTVVNALASLQFKFQQKIREVGQLKKQLTEARKATALDVSYTAEVIRLNAINSALSDDLMTLSKSLRLSEFTALQHAQAYTRLQSHTQDVDGVLASLKGDVANWKSFSVVAFVLGVAVGALSVLAYIAQTAN